MQELFVQILHTKIILQRKKANYVLFAIALLQAKLTLGTGAHFLANFVVII